MIKLRVAAGAARPGPPLGPVLGQHQIKVADFVAEFNRLAAEYTPGVPLGVRVVRGVPPRFTLRVAPTPGVHLLRAGGPRPGRTHLWDVLRATRRTTPAGGATLLGTLRSTRWTPA